jgi:hypothetical protein
MPATPIIGAAGFGSVWMLLWGLTAVVPVIIHLWSRRRHREVAWAAMEYLQAAVRRNARRIQLEQFLLLAARVLILVLLALALADPMLRPRGVGSASSAAIGRTHTLLVIDGSYSMDAKESGQSQFELAKRKSIEYVEQSREGDGFTLLLMSDSPQTIIESPAFDSKDVAVEIENLTLTHGGARLPETLDQVQDILRAVQDRHPRLRRSRVVFFTDLGRNTWKDIQRDACRSQIGQIAELAEMELVELQPASAQNLAVTDFRPRGNFATVEGKVTFLASVQNFGSQPVAQHTIDFLVDGNRIDQRTVDIPAAASNTDAPAAASTTVSFHYQFEGPGEHFAEVRLGPDPLEVDNHRFCSLPVRQSLQVLCIDGKPGAARHVALALQPSRSDRPLVQPHLVTETALLEEDLHQYDGVFLCNVGRFGHDEAEVLHDYVQNGGGLVVFLGDQVQADNYNRELGGQTGGPRVLPARIGTVAEAAAEDSRYGFDPRGYHHPIVRPFRGHEQSGLLTTPVWRYLKLEPYDQSQATVALWFRNGDPAIVEEPIGQGRSILLATAASTASRGGEATSSIPWTLWSSWPSFPPLVHEMLALAVQGRIHHRNVLVGEDLSGSLADTPTDLSLTVSSPDQRKERVRMVIDGQQSHWTYSDTWQSGFYLATYDSPELAPQWYAVNVDTGEDVISSESNPAHLRPDDLPPPFGSESWQTDRDVPLALASRSPWPAFRIILAAVLLLLLLETFLAWLFGNARA